MAAQRPADAWHHRQCDLSGAGPAPEPTQRVALSACGEVTAWGPGTQIQGPTGTTDRESQVCCLQRAGAREAEGRPGPQGPCGLTLPVQSKRAPPANKTGAEPGWGTKDRVPSASRGSARWRSLSGRPAQPHRVLGEPHQVKADHQPSWCPTASESLPCTRHRLPATTPPGRASGSWWQSTFPKETRARQGPNLTLRGKRQGCARMDGGAGGSPGSWSQKPGHADHAQPESAQTPP
ncbi:unnamed protein product [Rangifer tarandus platyrhynchus]|uniref:Uncharacterized protein n=1 Tax=Rangifer tarandus platyrhynchus TaxID=3082113 RepID=A0ABN8YH58_RANTA|nr:unnamed protein product [Rangifer tarandus platyrhynchus]